MRWKVTGYRKNGRVPRWLDFFVSWAIEFHYIISDSNPPHFYHQNKINWTLTNWMTLVLRMVFFFFPLNLNLFNGHVNDTFATIFCFHSLRFYTGYWLQIYSLFIIRSTYRIERRSFQVDVWKSSYICKFNHIQLFAGHITLAVIFAGATTKNNIFKNTLKNLINAGITLYKILYRSICTRNKYSIWFANRFTFECKYYHKTIIDYAY